VGGSANPNNTQRFVTPKSRVRRIKSPHYSCGRALLDAVTNNMDRASEVEAHPDLFSDRRTDGDRGVGVKSRLLDAVANLQKHAL
jgi:hypothetical protein